MKKIYFLLLICICICIVNTYAQTITTTPAFPTQDAAVTVTFDATSTPLKGYTGDLYAHMGVVTDASNGLWSHVVTTWGENSAKSKLTRIATDKYTIAIDNIRQFYGVSSTENVLKLAFVFRSSDAKTQSDDVFYQIYEPGLQVRLEKPESGLITAPTTYEIKAVASQACNLTVYVNNNQVAQASSATNVTGSFSVPSAGGYSFKVVATDGTTTVSDTRLITYKGTVVDKPVPAGIEPGINYSADGTSATLRFQTPIKGNPNNAYYITDVYVIGDFNNWVPSNESMMYRASTNPTSQEWWITVNNLVPGKEYGFQYLVSYKNGTTKRIGDPYAEKIMDPWNDKWINKDNEKYPGLVAYPEEYTSDIVSVLQPGKSSFSWQYSGFKKPNKQNLLVYEMLLRDFTSERTVKAAMGKLDYLQALGVNAIELMPILEFDGNDSWGYNPMYFFASDKAYGTETDYKRFIDECHKRNIAVILDVVFNHATGNNSMAKLYWDSTNDKTASVNYWFNVDATHKYSVFHDFNHGYKGTQDFVKRVMKYWLTEYKVDGFRLDLAKGILGSTSVGNTDAYNAERIGYLKMYHDYAKSINPDVYFILELLGENSEEKELGNSGMLLWGKMLDAAKQCNMGYAPDSNLEWMSAVANGGRGWSQDNLVAYQESHDEERQGYNVSQWGADKSDHNLSYARMASTAALFSMVKGPKMIWQFEELGYDYSIMYDPDTDTTPATDEAKMKAKPIRWDYFSDPDRQQIYNAYRAVMALRNQYPDAFVNGTMEWQVGNSDWNLGKRVAIKHSSMNAVVVSNLTSSAISSQMSFAHTGTWYNVLTGESLNVTDVNQKVAIPARDFRLYADKQVSIPSGMTENIANQESILKAVYNASSSEIEFYINGEIALVELYSVNGNLVNRVSHTSVMNVSGLSNGCYIARAILGNGTVQTCKVIK